MNLQTTILSALILLFGVGIPFAIWFDAIIGAPDIEDLSFKGVHHIYYGTILLIFALWSLRFDEVHWYFWPLWLIGTYVNWDDAIQHYKQRNGSPAYKGTLRWLTDWLWQFSWVRAIGEFLDRLTGRKKS